ncbi:MAG: bifunctional folylpolyglutamate synthase/dihydrofolate synthase, partial [Aliifodinibius sp.]|nr:bifunctional folylpolyglutamate synthase/dihydrofolate synthase [candidate division Zixibacteria bacterium]NIT59732.1 bifunctional folylpolyglutamate synthase/dihydrofolate synthase [Fodinibius sp.]NIW47182.1 bifunctional folylpolyglutamate synthase/dihydrofolate synthase [Gammaproteobacteria bacterium]NIY28315.1 bifunctional folylpolyglutamate synthase/dihydrofolate synthase [Fodinibius sp.]
MKKIVDYQSALDYIYSFIDNSRTHQQNLSPENFNLSRVRNLCEMIGNPQTAYWSVHVAGSKGKGSVCAMIASVLEEAGYQVGLYTSPHLEEFSERIQVNGKPVDENLITETLQYLREFIDQIEDI